MSVTIYETIYKKLEKLLECNFRDFPDLQSRKIKSSAFMDLNIDVIYSSQNAKTYQIALSHYYEHPCGDLIPDPDMEIKIYPELHMAEALTFQDTYVYLQVYPEPDKVNVCLKKQLNKFLIHWLKNLKAQGFYH